jgi:hypothetical protein
VPPAAAARGPPAAAFQQTLAANPGAPGRDLAMVRLALALALADRP